MTNNLSRLAIIGATGSVGKSVLDICRTYPEKFKVAFLVAHQNIKKMSSLINEFHPVGVALTDHEAARSLRELHPDLPIYESEEDLEYIVTHPDVDHVVFASSGTDAIRSLQKALDADKNVSLANKESIVVAAPWVMPLVKRRDQLRPLDSEHNAIWQCLIGENVRNVKEIFLTASGGPFRTYTREKLSYVTPEMALSHPVWNMGYKVTVDSATLMNKGIEIIEAMYLFNLDNTQVHAIICPGSIVHGIVHFSDGTVKMVASTPDMRMAAATALAYPERLPTMPLVAPLAFAPLSISFYSPDESLFPSLALAKEVACKKGPFPAILVGADEIAVDAFMKKKINFTQIPVVIEKVLSSYNGKAPETLEESLQILQWGKVTAQSIVRTLEK